MFMFNDFAACIFPQIVFTNIFSPLIANTVVNNPSEKMRPMDMLQQQTFPTYQLTLLSTLTLSHCWPLHDNSWTNVLLRSYTTL